MKKTSLILGTLALAIGIMSCSNGQQNNSEKTVIRNVSDSTIIVSGDIVYIDLDRIISEYDMANDLRATVESRLQKINAEVTKKGQKLEKDIKKFQEDINKGVLLQSVAQKKQEELLKAEQEFNQYAAQKQQEMQEEEIVMMNQIADAIKTFIDKYNQEMGYAMILTNSGGTPVITANENLNITEDVLTKLNEEYVKSLK